VQFDCGKLQALAPLLRALKSGGHKVVIFTQMTKVLDILERFLNLYSYSYVRLDGTTKPEQRQILMQRFNADSKLFAFILSTRSGGFGINLTGADTVIFYDSDWNPAVDAQAQDRCHRIGQTREVNIYRLISEDTIEENIFKKALQKRELDDLAIQKGRFNLNSFEGEGELQFLDSSKQCIKSHVLSRRYGEK
jgi:SNF2 family DNA or RNA helicase